MLGNRKPASNKVAYNILLDNTCHNLKPLSEDERLFMLRTCIEQCLEIYKPYKFQMEI